ncbi:MAG: hypothetical protein C4344_05875, partial [Acidimicrobiia bacterium]
MRFRTEHRFVAAPAEVVAALVDPDFHAGLRLPDLAPVEVLAAGEGWIRLRYEFVGSLDPLARRLLAGRPLRWVQELRASADGGRLTFAA